MAHDLIQSATTPYGSPHVPQARSIARGQGWAINELICEAGPEDRPFEEQHDTFTIALVAEGSFNYRSETGHALLHAGSLLLGNWGQCFSCGHSHSRGDRCLALHVQPSLFMDIAATTTGTSAFRFPVGMLPATRGTLPFEIELTGRDAWSDTDIDVMLRDEITIGFIARLLQHIAGVKVATPKMSPNDEKRMSRVFRHLGATLNEPQSLDALADVAAMSKFHFLRTFRHVAGVTPHKYVLGRRMARVGLKLRTTREAVSAIAFSEGFGDLSTFNRQFREIFGGSPNAYRKSSI
jgi:AraC family transcriptional regulator